jgi:hypothetical protein
MAKCFELGLRIVLSEFETYVCVCVCACVGGYMAADYPPPLFLFIFFILLLIHTHIPRALYNHYSLSLHFL